MTQTVIKNLDYIAKHCSECPDVITFEPTFNVQHDKMNKDDLTFRADTDFQAYPYYSYLEHVPYPYRKSPVHDALLPIFRLVRAGKTVILKVSPTIDTSLSFALDFLGSLYHDAYDKNRSLWMAYDRMGYDPVEGYSDLPVPAGKVIKDFSTTFLWTRRWSFSMKKMEELFPYDINKSYKLCLNKLDEMLRKTSKNCQGKKLLDEIVKTVKGIPDIVPMTSAEMGKLVDTFLKNPDGELLTFPNIISQLDKQYNLSNRLRCPSDEMLKPQLSWQEGECPAFIQAIKREDMGWPVAFAVKFGKGEVIVAPSPCTYVPPIDVDFPESTKAEDEEDELAQKLDSGPTFSQRRGFALVSSYKKEFCSELRPGDHNDGLPDNENVHVSVSKGAHGDKPAQVPYATDSCFVISLPVPLEEEMDERSKITINVKQPNKEEFKEHRVTVRCFIEFLVIFLACNMGGIALISGELSKKKKLIAGLKKKRRQIVMMRDGKVLKSLPGGDLFFSNQSNVDTQIQRSINNLLFNERQPIGVDDLQEIARGRSPGAERLLFEEYSIERLQNIRLDLSESDMKSLKKFRFKISDDDLNAGSFNPMADFNKNAVKFFSMLEKILSKQKTLPSGK